MKEIGLILVGMVIGFCICASGLSSIKKEYVASGVMIHDDVAYKVTPMGKP